MGPGFRYHVTTLCAIFLALGVGMMIGTSFVQAPIVERQIKGVDDLGKQFRGEVTALRAQNKKYADFVVALPSWLRNTRLEGVRAALVITGDYPDTARKIRDTLEQAGAVVASQTTIDRTFATRLPQVLPELAQKLTPTHPSLGTDAKAALHLLASLIAQGGADADLNAFVDAGLLTREGDYASAVRFVILVGGASEEHGSRADAVDLPLIAELKSFPSTTVVAAEPFTAAISSVPAWRAADIATVDNADTDTGRIAVALAFRAAPGDYGDKPTALQGQVPTSPQP